MALLDVLALAGVLGAAAAWVIAALLADEQDAGWRTLRRP